MHGKRVLCFLLIFIILFQGIIYGIALTPGINRVETPLIKTPISQTTTKETPATETPATETPEKKKAEYGFLTPLITAIQNLIDQLSGKNDKIVGYDEYVYNDEIFKKMIEEMLNDETLNKEDSYSKMFKDTTGESRIAHFPLHVKDNLDASSIAVLGEDFIRVDTKKTGLIVIVPWKLGVATLYSQYLEDEFKIKNPNSNTPESATSAEDKDFYTYMNYYINAKYYAMGYDKSTNAVGMDNYGNIITNKGDIIVPFYMNTYFIDQIDKADGTDSLVVDRLKDDTMISKFKGFSSYDGGPVELEVALLKDSGETEKVTIETSKAAETLGSEEGKTQEMVDFIYENFKGAIEEYNGTVFRNAEDNPEKRELFEGESDYDYPNLNEDPMAQLDFKLKSMIMTVLEGGFGELITLTWAYLVNVAYQELFIDFSSRYVFNTSTLRDTGSYYMIRNMYSAISIALILLLFIISLYRFLGGESTIRKTLGQVAMVILIFFIPFQVYPILTNVAMNKPVENILNEQINQIMLMDRWLYLDKERFDSRKELLPIELVQQSRVFRKSDFNYSIAFRTREHIGNLYGDTQNLSQINNFGETEAKTKASKTGDDRYTVNVELGHLIDYYKYNTSENESSGDSTYTLFDFLLNKYSGDYSGITGFAEFEMYVTSDSKSKDYSTFKYSALNKDSIETEGFIKASEIGKKVFEYYDDIEQGESLTPTNSFNPNDISERGRIITEKIVFDQTKTGQNKDEILSRLHDGLIEYDEDGNIIYDYTELLESGVTVDEAESERLKDTTLLMQDMINPNSKDSSQAASDTFMIYNLLYSMAYSSTETINKADKINIGKMAEEINNEVYDYYLNNFWDIENTRIADGSVGDNLYKTALNDLLKLKISFEITERLSSGYGKYSYQDRMPTNIDFGRVQGDVYLKSLVIPINELDPSNRSTDTAALYVTTTKSAFTHVFFIALIIILALYGLLKFGVVSIAIVPIAIFMTIFKFIRHKENDDYMAAWIGAGYILGIFGAVNLGLIGIMTVLIQGLNTTVSSDLSGGMNMFSSFVTVIVTLAYMTVTFKFILVPTVKIAAQNMGDLGASQFNNIAKNVTDRVKDSVAGRAASYAYKGFMKSRDENKPKTKEEALKDKKKDLGLGSNTETGEKYKSNKELVNRVTKEGEVEGTGEVKEGGVAEDIAKAGASRKGGTKGTKPIKTDTVEGTVKPKNTIKTSKEIAESVLAEKLKQRLDDAKILKNTGKGRTIKGDKVDVVQPDGKIKTEALTELSAKDAMDVEEEFGAENKSLGKELARNFNNIEKLKAGTKEKKVFTDMSAEDTTIFEGNSDNIETIARDLGRNKVEYEVKRNKDNKSTIKVKTSALPENNNYSEIEGVEQNGYRDMTVKYDKKLIKSSKNWLGENDTLIENDDNTMTIRKGIDDDSSTLAQDKHEYTRIINEEASKLKLDTSEEAVTFKGTSRELKSVAYMAETAGEQELANMIRANCDSGELELSSSDYNKIKEKINNVGNGSESILGEKKYIIDSILRNNPIKTAEEIELEKKDYIKNKINSTINSVGEEVKTSFKNRIQELAELNKKNKGE